MITQNNLKAQLEWLKGETPNIPSNDLVGLVLKQFAALPNGVPPNGATQNGFAVTSARQGNGTPVVSERRVAQSVSAIGERYTAYNDRTTYKEVPTHNGAPINTSSNGFQNGLQNGTTQFRNEPSRTVTSTVSNTISNLKHSAHSGTTNSFNGSTIKKTSRQADVPEYGFEDEDDDDIIDLTLESSIPHKRNMNEFGSSKKIKSSTADFLDKESTLNGDSTNKQSAPRLVHRQPEPLRTDLISTNSDSDKLVPLLKEKIQILLDKIQIDSTVLSSFSKEDFDTRIFQPKLLEIDARIAELERSSHTRIPPSAPDLPSPAPRMTSTQLNSQGESKPTEVPKNNVLDDLDDFNTSDFGDDDEITPPKIVQQSSKTPFEAPVREEVQSVGPSSHNDNVLEAKQYVLEARARNEDRRSNLFVPETEEVEDEFGENSMEGLYTQSQDRDEYEDLGSFIVNEGSEDILEDDDASYAEGMAEEVHSDDNTQPDSPVRDANEVVPEDEEFFDDVEEIEEYTASLNAERELTHNVIELISDEEEDEVLDMNARQAAANIHEVVDSLKSVNIASISKPVYEELDSDFSDFSDGNDDILQSILSNEKAIPVHASNSVVTNGSQIVTLPGTEHFVHEVYKVLNSVFKLKAFRQNQLEAVTASLLNKDVFVLMPTGGGKSLCYQLPALIKGAGGGGTTVVISPLISLMQDQVQHMLDLNVKAGMISSKANSDDNKQMLNLFREGFLQIVYLSPEKANKSIMIQKIIGKLYDNGQLARVVIDEAHCLSSWGHDFRPDYQGMGFFKQKFPKTPLMALTATANEKVIKDIMHNLNMNNPVFLKQSFNRSNLFYEIKWKSANHLEWIKDYVLGKQNGKCGIIYCHSKNSCEQTSAKLNSYGLNTSFYHAGMSPQDRFTVQNMWQQNSVQLICATIAFGMGIDKPDVRFVIHLYIPRSLEGYYQETGRAGRDGKESECIMFYSYKDARSLQSMIHRDDELTREGKENHLAKLRQVVQYCENTTDCRREQVLQYFNESFKAADCKKMCDNCANASTSTTVEKDCTEYAKDIIKMVQSMQNEKVTILHCQDVFKGSNNRKIMSMGHNNSPYHSKGKHLDKTDVERIFFYLLSKDCLMEYQIMKAGFASNYVRLGRTASQVLNNQLEIKINFSTTKRVQNTAAAPTTNTTGHVTLRANTEGNLNNFRYQGSFVTARQMSNGDFGESNGTSYSSGNAPKSDHTNDSGSKNVSDFVKLNKIRLDISSDKNLAIHQVLSDVTLRDAVTKLPTNKKDFAKLTGITKEQLEFFNQFKKELTSLSRERKKSNGEGSPNTTISSSLDYSAVQSGGRKAQTSIVSPYFQPSQQDQQILNALRGTISQGGSGALPVASKSDAKPRRHGKSSQRPNGVYKKRSQTSGAGRQRPQASQARKVSKGMPI